jgi:release factor glutamine methyltransferase
MIPYLSIETPDNVYEPREDSWLFVDALREDVGLITSLRPSICLEIGPGTGVITTHLSTFLANIPMLFLCADVNVDAARATKTTFNTHNSGRPHHLDCVVSDLDNAFGGRLDGLVDVLLFNPPYVPTDECELGFTDIRASYAGGPNGRTVIDRFLPCVPRLLSPSGVCYLLLVLENEPLAIAKEMGERYQLMPHIVARVKAKNERLFVIRFQRKQHSK